jgi:hypothetical protein
LPRKLSELFEIEFVRVLCVDCLARLEPNLKIDSFYKDGLPGEADQMAFDATEPLVINGPVLESRYVEIGVKLAVDTREKVAVESRSDA